MFRVQAPAPSGKKPPPATTTAFRDGVAVPACASSFGSVASPDPCVVRNFVDAAAGNYVVSIRTSGG